MLTSFNAQTSRLNSSKINQQKSSVAEWCEPFPVFCSSQHNRNLHNNSHSILSTASRLRRKFVLSNFCNTSSFISKASDRHVKMMIENRLAT
ncbi:CLUMA_CG016632, isoform A [Clunio marinus]|uniref:CLUMA_CG016632, isoform A n=1 Tax=Clunio marinus TaxID=568069 RepID=A0A1J1IT70_9DIPT|nr:CLUMA_CG016632, isoform A [Clunio marinus]